MVRSRDNSCVTAEQSPTPPGSPSTRRRRPGALPSKKRQKIASSETETRVQIETLKPNLSRALSSCTRRDTNSCVRRHDKSRRKSRRTVCQRKWTYSARDVSKYNDRVVIVSYNVLGVENAARHPQLYCGVSPDYLDWDYRKKLMCKEIRGYQEDGFRGFHKGRSGDSHDGCAIFWKSELFTLLHEENLEFQSFGLRNNVTQFCVLEMNQDLHGTDATSSASTSHSIVVGNIHVLYNPKRGDIKLGQIRIFLEKAYELSQEWGCIPVVLTGDFNSLPQSASYQFVASSKLHILKHDRRQISGQMFRGSQYLHNHVARWTDEEKKACYWLNMQYPQTSINASGKLKKSVIEMANR